MRDRGSRWQACPCIMVDVSCMGRVSSIMPAVRCRPRDPADCTHQLKGEALQVVQIPTCTRICQEMSSSTCIVEMQVAKVEPAGSGNIPRLAFPPKIGAAMSGLRSCMQCACKTHHRPLAAARLHCPPSSVLSVERLCTYGSMAERSAGQHRRSAFLVALSRPGIKRASSQGCRSTSMTSSSSIPSHVSARHAHSILSRPEARSLSPRPMSSAFPPDERSLGGAQRIMADYTSHYKRLGNVAPTVSSWDTHGSFRVPPMHACLSPDTCSCLLVEDYP